MEATGSRAHNLDGVSEPYNGGTRNARFADGKVETSFCSIFYTTLMASNNLTRQRFVLLLVNQNDLQHNWKVNYYASAPQNDAAILGAAPRVCDTPASKLLSRHQRIDSRQLCFFGFNEKRWSATLSVADALAETEELISKL